MEYTKKDFKVYGKRPKVTSLELAEVKEDAIFANQNFFEYLPVDGDSYLRRFRWFKVNDSIHDDLETFVDDVIDIRSYNDGEEFNFLDLQDYIKDKYPKLYEDKNCKWLMMSTVMISEGSSVVKEQNHAFFDVVDNKIVIRVVVTRWSLISSNKIKNNNGLEVKYDVEDLFFTTLQRRPATFVYDLEYKRFQKVNKGDIERGTLPAMKTSAGFNRSTRFKLADTVVENDLLMESLGKSIVKHGYYAKNKDVIKYLLFNPFTDDKLINGDKTYTKEAVMLSLYAYNVSMNTIVEESIASKYVKELTLGFGFLVDIERFEYLIRSLVGKNLTPELSLADIFEVNYDLIGPLAQHIKNDVDLGKIDKLTATNRFAEYLLTAKNLIKLGIRFETIVNNLDKISSSLELYFTEFFETSLFGRLEKKILGDKNKLEELKSKIFIRISEFSSLRFVDIDEGCKMYIKYLEELKKSAYTELLLSNYNFEESFDLIFPLDVQLELNKMGVYGYIF